MYNEYPDYMDMLDAECCGCEYEHGCMGNIDASLKNAVKQASETTGIEVTILEGGIPCRGQSHGLIGIVTHACRTDHGKFWEIVNTHPNPR